LADIGDTQTSASFVRELRRVLHHLYDWVELSKSPLVELFDVEQRGDAPSTLRAVLRQAIESLKPSAGVSPKAKAWRTYQVLHARYIEQFTQREVASELGLSIRHLRREESLAVQTLAAYLWDHYNLERKWQAPEDRQLLPEEEEISGADVKTPTQEQELDWVHDSLPSKPVDVGKTIQAALKLVDPLAQTSEVHIDCKIPESLPAWVVQPTPIQQAFLIIFTVAVGRVPGGQVSIRAGVDGSEVYVYVQTKGSRSGSAEGNDELERIEMARQLIELSEGSLEITPGEGKKQPFTFKIALPAEEQIPVLVIDDNVDTLQLLERYLSNSRYRFIGTSDPQQALQLAVASNPQIILLDVMLPDVDGWELLGRLHTHPQTHDVPIIVCTILPQEQLALNLGAAAFMKKPVSRTELLSVLDHLLDRPLIESD
jgi:CheY-like chemotaxis protein